MDVLLPYQFFLFDEKGIPRCLHEQIVGLLLLADFLKKLKVKSIFVVLPYMPYSRQTSSFDGKFAGPIPLWGNFFKSAGINTVFSCDLHAREVLSLFTGTQQPNLGKAQNLSGADLIEIDMSLFWVNHLQACFSKEIRKNNLCIASPDRGGYDRAKKVAEILKVPVAYVNKQRIGPDLITALNLDGDVAGKTVVVLDDIIDTGETAVHACRLLKKEGATKVSGMFTHAVFAPGAIECIRDSDFDQIFVSDTLPVQFNLKKDKIIVKSCNELIVEKVLENLKTFNV